MNLPPPRRSPPSQPSLFDMGEDWVKEWKGMPEFVCEDLSPFKVIIVNFTSWSDVQKFAKITGNKITADTRAIWFPKADRIKVASLRYKDGKAKQHCYVEWKKAEPFVVPAGFPRTLPADIEAIILAYDTCLDKLT